MVNDLHNAASVGSAAQTLAVLSTGSCDIDGGKWTPLMIAACHGYPDVVEILLDRGANASKKGDKGATALHGAAQGGFVDVTRHLVKAGAELDAATFSNGSTPLHMAASKGETGVMNVLMEAGADPNNRRLDGATPLNRAAEGGHVRAVKLLLRANVDPLLDATDQAGNRFYPLEVAAALGHVEVVSELIQHFGIEGCGGARGGGLDALEVAANVETTAVLMAEGVVDTGSAALIYAARKGRAAITNFLLQQLKGSSAKRRRAYVNARCKNGSGTTPLLASICSPSVKIARSLVDAGADMTLAANAELDSGELVFGVTPLSWTGRLLIEKKAEKRRRLGKGVQDTENQINGLKAIRRLLLQAEAVRAVSWLWPSTASPSSALPAAVEGSSGTQPASTTLTAATPILLRRAQRPRALLAALFRWVVVR